MSDNIAPGHPGGWAGDVGVAVDEAKHVPGGWAEVIAVGVKPLAIALLAVAEAIEQDTSAGEDVRDGLQSVATELGGIAIALGQAAGDR